DHLGLIDQAELELLHSCSYGLPRPDDILFVLQRHYLVVGHHRVRVRLERNICMPRSTSSAVCTPGNSRPSSTRVMATAGRMPTTMVRASRIVDIADMLAIMRPMNESTTSSAEMSMRTPLAPVA